MFDQIVAMIDNKVFEALKDEYLHNVDIFKGKYPTIIFDKFTRQLRRGSNKTK
jgi:hypothetical protein